MLRQVDTYYYGIKNFLLYGSTALIFVYFTLLLQNYNISTLEIGLILSASYIGTFISPLIFLKLKFNIKNIRNQIFLFGIVHILIGIGVSTFWALMFILFLYGMTRNVMATYLETQTMNTFKEKYGIIRGVGSLGFLLTTYVVGLFFSVEVIQNVLMVTGIIILIFSLFMEKKYKGYSFKEEGFDFTLIFNNKLYWSFILLFHTSLGILFSFLTIYLIDRGYQITDISNVWNISVLAEVLMFWFFVKFKHLMKDYNFVTFTIIATMIRFLILYIYPESLVLVLIAQSLHMLTFSIFHINSLSIINKLLKGNEKMGIKLYFSIGYGLSFSIGALVGGLVYSNELFIYTTLITGMSLVLWLFFVKKNKTIL